MIPASKATMTPASKAHAIDRLTVHAAASLKLSSAPPIITADASFMADNAVTNAGMPLAMDNTL